MNENDRVMVYNDDLASTGMPRNLFRVLYGWGFGLGDFCSLKALRFQN